MNASDPPGPDAATPRERVALARLLVRFAAASTNAREIVGFVTAALQHLAVVLDDERHCGEAMLLRDCAARLGALTRPPGL